MTKHEFVARAVCPVDGSVDAYAVTVTTIEDIHVEQILAAAASLATEHIIQEEFTRRLFTQLAAFGVVVTTEGRHSGVKTTCQMPCCSWGR